MIASVVPAGLDMSFVLPNNVLRLRATIRLTIQLIRAAKRKQSNKILDTRFRCPNAGSSVIHVNAGYCIDKSENSHPTHSDWREDDCHSCRCKEDGTIKCYEEKCLSSDECSDRALMVKGRCCPVCSGLLMGAIAFNA